MAKENSPTEFLTPMLPAPLRSRGFSGSCGAFTAHELALDNHPKPSLSHRLVTREIPDSLDLKNEATRKNEVVLVPRIHVLNTKPQNSHMNEILKTDLWQIIRVR